MFDLNVHVARLLMDEPFFAVLSRQIEKRKTSGIPTAGVKINKDTAQFELYYNPTLSLAMATERAKVSLMTTMVGKRYPSRPRLWQRSV